MRLYAIDEILRNNDILEHGVESSKYRHKFYNDIKKSSYAKNKGAINTILHIMFRHSSAHEERAYVPTPQNVLDDLTLKEIHDAIGTIFLDIEKDLTGLIVIK